MTTGKFGQSLEMFVRDVETTGHDHESEAGFYQQCFAEEELFHIDPFAQIGIGLLLSS
ncbi:hypothetical protein AAFN85_03280 [Mucilaginibacter sp. CAU 1740]|uniref:hypothetical protein n=1 Tax=Mucilaginibacter sp. CAU 1740 TaxID=3140365 RepID=UPI00325AE4CE